MKKYTLLSGIYDSDTKISTTTIATPKGNFTSKTKLAKEDADIESTYFGCQIAEVKSQIKYVKKLKAEAQVSFRTLEKVNYTLSQCKDIDPKSRAARKVRRAMYEYRDQIKHYSDTIKQLEELIDRSVSFRAKCLREKESKDDNN